jgi:thiamine biosynthesis lipoprotein
MTAVDRRFQAMGCTIRLIIDDGRAAGSPPEEAFERAQRFVLSFDHRLSRFRADSELTRLNSTDSEQVTASALMRALVRAATWAAKRSGGLVDPTLGRDLAALGYSTSWPFTSTLGLEQALALGPERRPARPKEPATWRDIEIDDHAETVWRRPGIQIDSGGVGKGLAADALARHLRTFPRVLVDCGGDIAVSGTRLADHPFEVAVRHPRGDADHRFTLAAGGVATSGIDRRLWLREDGTVAHHLLDPSTGEPAWTGLISATAMGRTALEAETLAKTALLSGPRGAQRLLRRTGGLLVHDSGDSEVVAA